MIKAQKEDTIHKAFAQIVRGYESIRKLNCSFWSYDASGEYRKAVTGGLLKAKGLKPGQSDYLFKTIRNGIAHHIYIEFKTEKGKQSPNQKLFEQSCIAENEKYYIARSAHEGVELLIHEKIILP
jgi:hypothetical protein